MHTQNWSTRCSSAAGTWLRLPLWVVVFGLPFATPIIAAERISFSRVQRVVKDNLSKKPNYRPGDLICRDDVIPIFKQLAAAGWKPSDQKQIQADVLQDNDAVVRVLSTDRGRRFMRKVSGYELVYDRLDRIARASGGERLLQDLVKLPNGYKYAKMSTRREIPDLLDLLPKTRSGKTRSITDYREPTGRIYTEDDLLGRFKKSLAGKTRQKAATPARRNTRKTPQKS